MMQDSGSTIQAIAARCGMTAHTLRYYERVGLIQPVWRARNGHRRYSEQDEKWLKFLKSMRTTRMPIREMRRYAALHNHGDNRVAEQRNILEEHCESLEKQIADLQAAHALLTHNIKDLRKMEEATIDSVPEQLPAWTGGAIAFSK
ncbi:MAG TPA: MerR family transcriptional regulator [Terracidiphilus sp.]|jgi:DNA-binding transcriptional MerR regulator